MNTITITKELNVSAPKAWEHTAVRYGEIDKVNPYVHRSDYLDWHTSGMEGCERISYYMDDDSKFLKERLVNLNEANLSFTTVIIEAHNIAAVPNEMHMDQIIIPISEDQCCIEMQVFTKTLPGFISSVKQEFFRESMTDYILGLEHYIMTGELITPKVIRKIKAEKEAA